MYSFKQICDIFDLTNMVVDPTCFTKGASPSLNDVILTNKPNYCMNTNNYNCGHIISIRVFSHVASETPKFLCCRLPDLRR